MNPEKDLKKSNLDVKSILSKLKKYRQRFATHLPFAIIILVLVIYLVVVWQIKSLSAAEPSPESISQATSSTKISKIDKNAIAQIQLLEQYNPRIKALFDEARKNPFNE